MPLGLVVVLTIIAAWILHKVLGEPKPGTGDVELGVPTVTGQSVLPGSDVYYSRRTDSIELDPSNPAVDKRMRELIYDSTAKIAADDDLDPAIEGE